MARRTLGDLLTGALRAGPGTTPGPSAVQVVVVMTAVVSLGMTVTVAASAPVLGRPTHALVRQE